MVLDLIKEDESATESPVGVTETKFFTFDALPLESGERLSPVTIAYETYGTLNTAADNAILICHALTGDAHVAGISKESGKLGWWECMIGPGRPFDTNRFFIISSNVIGGCKGSTGPGSINPKTGTPYGMSFPVVTVKDIVDAQARLVDHLGVDRLFCVAGGSMGGMQVLQWVYSYPDRVYTAIPIATTMRHTPQQIGFNEVGRRAIVSDPEWNGGDYYGQSFPSSGLAVARMIGHITYMSDESMNEKFGRRLRNKEKYGFDFEAEFEVEQYLKYRGETFVQRFDANSYLYITKAIDYFDLGDNRDLIQKFANLKTKFLVISYSHDWLYPPYQSKEIVRVLKYAWVDVTYCEISSTYGHDAFLIKNAEQEHLVSHFLGYARETLHRAGASRG